MSNSHLLFWMCFQLYGVYWVPFVVPVTFWQIFFYEIHSLWCDKMNMSQWWAISICMGAIPYFLSIYFGRKLKICLRQDSIWLFQMAKLGCLSSFSFSLFIIWYFTIDYLITIGKSLSKISYIFVVSFLQL